MRWVAESIAEQRLLWHLRARRPPRCSIPTTSTASTGADAPSRAARTRLREASVLADHRLAAASSAPACFFFCPARTSWRTTSPSGWSATICRCGARARGSSGAEWTTEAARRSPSCAARLTSSRRARAARVRTSPSRLRLEHLASFFERTVLHSKRPEHAAGPAIGVYSRTLEAPRHRRAPRVPPRRRRRDRHHRRRRHRRRRVPAI